MKGCESRFSIAAVRPGWHARVDPVADFLRSAHGATSGDVAGRVEHGSPARSLDGAGVAWKGVPAGTAMALIDKRVIQLFALVGEAIAGSTAVLLTGDRVAARELVRRDADIDARYRELDRAVLDLLAKGRPDEEMTHLVAVLRILPELERSGDLAEHIATHAAQDLARWLTPRARSLVAQMGALGQEMWETAAAAYAKGDSAAADQLRARDDEIDDLHVSLTAELAAGGISIPVAIEMGLVARYFERLGDHAVNVTRRLEQLHLPG